MFKKKDYFPFRFLLLPERKIMYRVKHGVMLTLPRVGETVSLEMKKYIVEEIRHFVSPNILENSIDIFVRPI